MNELTEKSATELAGMIRMRAVSPVEVVKAYLRRVEKLNPRLNAIVTLAPDAPERARQAEAAIRLNEKTGPLHGVPVTVKDTIETRGLRTTCGSPLRADHVPNRDAPAVALLKQAGAIVLGKTNVSELAMELTTDNPVFGRTNNPHDETRTPGGSSGGEAAAISARLSPAGIGSDLGGSIRVPAHCCGIIGLKPTTNRVPGGGHLPPITGTFALGACIGPLARRVEDLALMYHVLTAFDPSERMIVQTKSGWEWRREELRGWRVAWYTEDGVVPITTETKRAVEDVVRVLTEAGMTPQEVRPPGVERGPTLWFSLFAPAASDFIREMYAGREDEAGPTFQKMIRSAENPSQPAEDEHRAALIEREHLRGSLIRWMNDKTLIVAPVGAAPAIEHGARRLTIGDKSVGWFRAFGYAQTFNVFGLPAVSVPAGRSPEGLPIGVQIIGRPYAENAVLSAAYLVEQGVGGWHPSPYLN